MDDRNIVRAVLFSAAVQIALDTHQKFGKVPGTFITKDEYEKHIMDDAGRMINYMVDAANIHDEDCPCRNDEEEKPEPELKEVSFNNLEDLERAIASATGIEVKMEIGGERRACKKTIMGREAMMKHVIICEEIKKKRAGS